MGGFFGVALKHDCVFDLFFGTDYHSHLGTRRGGMVVYGEAGFERAIHNIENAPFRTKFERDVNDMKGNLGIGCISDYEPQPLIVRSHLGNFAITTVGRINNAEALVEEAFAQGTTHFLEMSGGNINATELVAALINAKDSIPEGIRYAQSRIDGSMSMLVLTPRGLYAARDRLGRTPVVVGKKDEGYCAVFESSAYLNLGYADYRELGPGEVDFITPEGVEMIVPPGEAMKICTFLWVYYGYPTSAYEGTNVEAMRCACGGMLAKRDRVQADTVAGVPDSGTAYAIGRAVAYNEPLFSHVLTLSGDAVKEPGNFIVPDGASFQELLDFAGGLKEGVTVKKALCGGPMMGIAMGSLDVPIQKMNNGLVLLTEDPAEKAELEMTACLHCGRCTTVCPLGLMPQLMADAIVFNEPERFEKKLYGLECIQCGSCTYICPAKRPLMQMFKQAKSEILARKRAEAGGKK